MVFIKIVGTANSANEVFHCVHFECPSQVSTDLLQKSIKNEDQSSTSGVSLNNKTQNFFQNSELSRKTSLESEKNLDLKKLT